jgi:hypothetical protein
MRAKLKRLRSVRLIRPGPKVTKLEMREATNEITDSSLLASTSNHF